MVRSVVVLCAFALLPLAAGEAPRGLTLIFEDDFEKGADRWEPLDRDGWQVIQTQKGNLFSQFKAASTYNPPHRSPFHIALVKDIVVGDFVLEAKCQSTAKDYPHRDLCLFFGYQDAAHFYYAHLGK